MIMIKRYFVKHMKYTILIFGMICLTLILQTPQINGSDSSANISGHIKVDHKKEPPHKNMIKYDSENAGITRTKKINQQCAIFEKQESTSLIHKDKEWNLDLNTYVIEKLKFIIHIHPKTERSAWQMAIWNNSLPHGSDLWQDSGITSTIWQDHVLEGYGIKTVARYKLKKLKTIFKSTFSMITVAHPFVRLESVYIDKLSRQSYFQRLHGKEIMKMFRYKQDGNDGFEYRTGRGVTFEEFLKYVIEKPNIDNHWKPFSVSSHPCNINYSFIAKAETITEDMNYIIDSHLTGRGAAPSLTDKNMYLWSNEKTPTNHGVLLENFTGLDDPKFYIEKLMQIYGDDI